MPPARPPKPRMFASLAIRDFRFLWFGNLAATLAMQMQMIARGWLIYDMTQSPTQLAWVMLSFSLPMILFSLFGGVAADRLTKRSVMFVAQTANAASTFLLAAIVISGQIEFWHFIVFGVFNGAVMSFSMPARQAMVPEIVGDAQLVNAIALNSATMNLSRVLGPSLAGAIIAVLAGGDTSSQFSVGVVFALNGLLYLASVLSLLMVDHRGYSTMQAGSTIWNDVAESFRYIWGYRLLRGLIILMFVPLLFGFPIQSLMPVFNHDVLNGGPADLGLLLSAMGGGAIVGSIILARLGDTPYKGRVLYSCAFLWAVTLAGLAISRTVPSALFACALMGLVSSIFMSMHMSVVTVIIDPAMRGRVMSILMMTFGLMPLGALPVSFVAESAGIDIALLGCAFGLAALAGVLLLTVRELRRIDTTAREAPLEPAPESANVG